MMETIRYLFIGLAVVAAVSVFRNPLKVWPNTIAGILYLLGAASSLLLRAWWPLIAGWCLSLGMQALCVYLIGKGTFSAQVNAQRAARGRPPLPPS